MISTCRVFSTKLGVVVHNFTHQLFDQLLADHVILHSVTICRELRHSDQTIKSEHVGTDLPLHETTPGLSSTALPGSYFLRETTTGLSSLPPGSIAAAVVEHETRLHLLLLHDEDLSAPGRGVTNRRGIRPSHQMLASN
jgi:hypothetical protein